MADNIPATPTADVSQAVRTMQIIAGALMIGVMLFTIVAVVAHGGRARNDIFLPLLFVLITVPAIIARFIVPMMLVDFYRRKIVAAVQDGELKSSADVAARLFGVYQTKLIISLALLEGGAFLNNVAYIVAGQWWSLATAGILLLMMAIQFPTRNRLEYWVHEQLQLMEMDRVA